MSSWQERLRSVEPDDRERIDALVTRWWGAPVVVSRGKTHRPAELEGYLAEVRGELAGLVTLYREGDECEVVTLNSEEPGSGLGAALMHAAIEHARSHACQRLWLITTNDNTHALRFYQRLGLRIAAVRIGAVDEARRLKPEIPLTGHGGIPIHDEIELAIELEPAAP
ncbi:MAG TPA: GNAT family N-acetyltransferase [Dehalococcoidia bacterium]|nr:GNAT family N-acetyltransferase [Dehalococcoidia bacterium]